VTGIRNYGINYDTGLTADDCTCKRFDDPVVLRRSPPPTPEPGHDSRQATTCPAGIVRTAAYDVDVPFMQLGRHGWDIHAV
jgi:hypothetical protein